MRSGDLDGRQQNVAADGAADQEGVGADGHFTFRLAGTVDQQDMVGWSGRRRERLAEDPGAVGVRVVRRQSTGDVRQFLRGVREGAVELLADRFRHSHAQRTPGATFQQAELHQPGDMVAGGLEILLDEREQPGGHLVGEQPVAAALCRGCVAMAERLQQQRSVRGGQQAALRFQPTRGRQAGGVEHLFQGADQAIAAALLGLQ